MSKIILESPVKSITGKLSKSDNAYFSNRNGKIIFTKVYNQYDGGNSTKQKAIRARFSAVQSKVREILADPSQRVEWEAKFKAQNKFATIRGFIFSSIYDQVA